MKQKNILNSSDMSTDISIYRVFLIPQAEHTEKYWNFKIDLENETHLASYQQQNTAGYF